MWPGKAKLALLLIQYSCLTTCCSPPQNYRPIGLIGRSILASNIIIAKVEEIKSEGDPYFVPYTACVSVVRALKNVTQVPEKLCIGKFGGEELCLLHVEVNKTYVMFLNRDYTARYDDLHGAAQLAVKAVINQIEDAICTKQDDCERPKVQRDWKNKMVVKEGKDLDLECRPNGTTPYLISWLWNNNNLGLRLLTTTTNRLQIRKISSRWSGRFTCVVKSPAGETSRSTVVDIDPIPCGGHLLIDKLEKPFGISSLNFPFTYPRDKTCTWRLCPPQGYALKIDFTDFALSGIYDDVEIFFECRENQTIQRVLWGKFCGSSVPDSIISVCKSNCVVLTQRAVSSKVDLQYNLLPSPGLEYGFKATFLPVRQEKTSKHFEKMFCAYDFIVKGRVKINGIISLIIEVLEVYLPANRTMLGELRLHYRYPLTDQRKCPISVDQGDVFIFLGIESDVFYKLIDIYQENEVRHKWIMSWKSDSTPGACD